MTRTSRQRPLIDQLPHPFFVKRNRKRGFTMMELLVFMLVIGVIMVGAFTTVSQSLRMVETSRDYARASQILQSEIERLRTKSWEQLAAIEAADGYRFASISLDQAFAETFNNRYRAYRWIRNRDSYSDQKEVTVWVVWKDAMGIYQNEMTTAWFTKNGLNDFYYRSF